MGKEGEIKPLVLTFYCIGIIVTLLLLAQVSDGNGILAADLPPAEQITDLDDVKSSDVALANCRYGVTSAETTAHFVPTSGAGVFYKFNQPNWYGPLPDNDAELLHMIRTRQRKTSTGEYLPFWYIQGYRLDEELAGYIRDDPGAVWIVGNEVERGPNPGETWTARTGDMYPEIYAEAYHDIYHFIKAIDPTARVANAGLIQVTPMRIQYLDKMWDAYQSKYGENMPVDVWTIHTYVLPELTVDGQPNNIASAALSTDISLGKRAAGGNTASCPDDMVYCFAEHDDLSILRDQIMAMRQWMNERGEREKPLIITEYGTLYHYKVKEDGACGRRDEFGNCFVPERVTKFMLDSFEYFNNAARDDNLGLSSDNNRLVQQWIWYGVWEWDIGSSNLLTEWNGTERTMMGEAFRVHVQNEPTYVNLAVDEVSSTVIAYDDDETATANISVSFRNNGNVPVEDSFLVTFYSDANLSNPIGSTNITAKIRGCASRAYTAEVEWQNIPKGIHPFWVKVDSNDRIEEIPPNYLDNIGTGEVVATGPVYSLDIEIISDGEGDGGVVTIDPNEVAHTEGTEVTLTAVPFTGWTFKGWSGAIVSSNPIALITILADTEVTARFEQEQYKLDIKTIGQGKVIVDPEPLEDYYTYGDKVELRAVPNEGSRFVGWSGDIDSDVPSVAVTFEDDVAVTARFEKQLDNIEGRTFMPVTVGK